MSAFGEGYTLPKKGKKKRSSRARSVALSDPALDPTEDTLSFTTQPSAQSNSSPVVSSLIKVSKKTPSSKAKRSVPHPPSLEDSNAFKAEPEGFSTSTSASSYEEDRRRRIVASMMDEIDDDDTDLEQKVLSI